MEWNITTRERYTFPIKMPERNVSLWGCREMAETVVGRHLGTERMRRSGRIVASSINSYRFDSENCRRVAARE